MTDLARLPAWTGPRAPALAYNPAVQADQVQSRALQISMCRRMRPLRRVVRQKRLGNPIPKVTNRQFWIATLHPDQPQLIVPMNPRRMSLFVGPSTVFPQPGFQNFYLSFGRPNPLFNPASGILSWGIPVFESGLDFGPTNGFMPIDDVWITMNFTAGHGPGNSVPVQGSEGILALPGTDP